MCDIVKSDMENLFLIKCQSEHLSLLQDFSIPYEPTCVELCADLKKGCDDFYIISAIEKPSSSSHIRGYFHFHKALHICLPLINENPTDYTELFKSFFKSEAFQNLSMIVGEKQSVDFLATILKDLTVSPKFTNEYIIMTLTQEPVIPPETLSADDEIKCCTKQDLDDLLPLQKLYLEKEVALPNQQITDNLTTLMLSNILKNQLVMAVSSGVNDGEFVSKINTNAIGTKWIQLGGIFTDPFNRRNYYAWHLIYTISKRIQKNNKNVCLFVKTKNIPAITLYKKIGFTNAGQFEILYF